MLSATNWKATLARTLRFEVRDEYGSVMKRRLSYEAACEYAHKARNSHTCDFMVVDTSTKRAVSEVFGFRYD